MRQNRRPYQRRPPRERYFVRSLTSENTVIAVSASQASLTALGGVGGLTSLGLLQTAPPSSTTVNVKDVGVIAPRMTWYRGQTTPDRVDTEWGSTYMRYYERSTAQSHFSIAIGKRLEADGLDELIAAFREFWNQQRRQSILRANGRAILMFGRQALASVLGENA